jgi:hypothetical protein
VLSFLGAFFADGNRGATAAAEVAEALDDTLYSLNTDQSRHAFRSRRTPTSRTGPRRISDGFDASTLPAPTRFTTR